MNVRKSLQRKMKHIEGLSVWPFGEEDFIETKRKLPLSTARVHLTWIEVNPWTDQRFEQFTGCTIHQARRLESKYGDIWVDWKVDLCRGEEQCCGAKRVELLD